MLVALLVFLAKKGDSPHGHAGIISWIRHEGIAALIFGHSKRGRPYTGPAPLSL